MFCVWSELGRKVEEIYNQDFTIGLESISVKVSRLKNGGFVVPSSDFWRQTKHFRKEASLTPNL